MSAHKVSLFAIKADEQGAKLVDPSKSINQFEEKSDE
jgi:hypothetical protein